MKLVTNYKLKYRLVMEMRKEQINRKMLILCKGICIVIYCTDSIPVDAATVP